MKFKKIISLMITSLAVLTICFTFGQVRVGAGDVITSTVNIAAANKNQRGPGYDWQNRFDILTLSGMEIDTEEPYGLRLPKNCTVILEGKNYIKAAKYGVSCSGTVIFKGSGSLIIDAGEIGMYLISQDNTQKIRLTSGKYEITAGKYGIYSDASDFSFVDGEMKINVTSPDGAAINGRCVNLLGGRYEANSPAETTQSLVVQGLDVSVKAGRAAFSSKNLTVSDLNKDYAGESEFEAKSAAKNSRKSAVFGDSVPGWVDYICLVVLAAGVAAGIFGPAMRRKKKAKELEERLRAEGYIE